MVTAPKQPETMESILDLARQRPISAADLELLPDDGNRYEIIGGQLIVSPSPSTRHQHVSLKLASALDTYLSSHGSGRVYFAPLDVRLSFYDVVQPDLLVVLNERVGIIQEQGIFGAPNLVVEILSPSSHVTDRVNKAALYARSGVQEYWIVDPDMQIVTVYGLDGDHFSPAANLRRSLDLYSIVLPGFVLDLDSIFPDPPLASRADLAVETDE